MTSPSPTPATSGQGEDALTRHLRLEGEVSAYNAASAQGGERPLTFAEYEARFDPVEAWAQRCADEENDHA